MTKQCHACRNTMQEPLYVSPENRSITTMNQLVDGRTYIYFCDSCGHLQTSELPNLDEYYANEYAVNATSEEDDHIYKVVGGKSVFRADHQVAVLRSKVELPNGAKVLDFGCAKSATMRKLLLVRPDIEPYLFDVTARYVEFWNRFSKRPSTAIGKLDPDWDGQMDVVMSFYMLEHVADLDTQVGHARRLLRPDGTFYFIVPNVYQNTADFIVADHINHFSAPSITVLLQRNGFDRIDVDATAHDSAFIVSARKSADSGTAVPPEAVVLDDLRGHALAMSSYWKGIVSNIREFEASLPVEAELAIYGAGFYANFIALSLQDRERVRVFVDQNPHLQGSELYGKPVLAPASLPASITHVMVGLNPRIARAGIDSIAAWKSRALQFLFL